MIVILGSLNLDIIGRVGRIPKPGETVPGTTLSTAPGGKGANQALAARRAGAAVKIVGAAGGDDFAGQALALLKDGGVDLSSVRRTEGPTGVAMIFVDDDGENVIAILPGANGTLTADDADTALHGLGPGDVLVLQQEVPQAATERALDLAKEQGVTAILNTAPFLDTTAALAPKASIVVANETEFALLCGGSADPLQPAMDAWAAKHGQTIIVTLGPDGARAAVPGEFLSVPALKVDPVDTVGAGDTFVGYLAAALDAGKSLETAMRRAAVAASLACLKPGAQPAIPLAAEVDRAEASA